MPSLSDLFSKGKEAAGEKEAHAAMPPSGDACPMCSKPMDPKAGDAEYSGMTNNQSADKRAKFASAFNKRTGNE